MIPDWTRLAPHRPLDPGDGLYEPPPSGVGDEIAKWVLAGGSTVLVGGPAGVGKSTELAQVAHRLQGERVACFVSVDRWENMRRITPDQLLLRVAGKLVHLAVVYLKLSVSHDLRSALRLAGVLADEALEQPAYGRVDGPAVDLARMAINEVSRLSRQGRVALVLDGLEKLPEGSSTLDVFDAVGALSDRADIVTVVPWHVAFGPQAAEPLVRAGEKFMAMRAPLGSGVRDKKGLAFLRAVLARRFELPTGVFDEGPSSDRIAATYQGDEVPDKVVPLVTEAALVSGGIPRAFLQILADAGTYAKLRRKAPWPDANDLADAIADQRESLRRALLPGDREMLSEFDGSDGLELDTAFKVRALANGLFLERKKNSGVILKVNPLLASIVGAASRA